MHSTIPVMRVGRDPEHQLKSEEPCHLVCRAAAPDTKNITMISTKPAFDRRCFGGFLIAMLHQRSKAAASRADKTLRDGT